MGAPAVVIGHVLLERDAGLRVDTSRASKRLLDSLDPC